jgi:NAD(P)-dependent dehydrogenase (short-subunit alcohol dehydrogenase family)
VENSLFELDGVSPRGCVALVTGANRGIGQAIVQALLDAGARRVYAAARHAPTDDVDADPRLVPLTLDITSSAQIARVASRARDVQVLINNAGIVSGQPLLAAADADAAEREMQVNYFGTLAMCRAFAPVLAANGGGAIVNILSILGRVASPRLGSYSASKAAAIALTQAIRGELASQRTLVVGVLPGFVDTDMARRVAEPKLPPKAVADSVVQALRDGTQDVYPGMAAEVERALRQDPKAVERRFAAGLV